MECEGTKVQVSTLLDANLDIEQVKELEGHLESCPSCAQFYEEQLELSKLLQVAENFQLEPPPAIWQRIDSQISAATERSSFLFFPHFNLRYALAGVVVLILVAASVLSLFTTRQEERLLLAELESYTLEVEGNPFLSQIGLKDPLFDLNGQLGENPFDKWRSIQ